MTPVSERIEEVPTSLDDRTLCLASIAISLKRIADALADPHRVGMDFAAGVDEVAFSIGQNVKRGWNVE